MVFGQALILMLSSVAIYIMMHSFFRYRKLRGRGLRGLKAMLCALVAASLVCCANVACLLAREGFWLNAFGGAYILFQIAFYTFVICFIVQMSVQDTPRNRRLIALLLVVPAIAAVGVLTNGLHHLSLLGVTKQPDGFGYIINPGPVTSLWTVYHNLVTTVALVLAVLFERRLARRNRNIRWVVLSALVLPILATIMQTIFPYLATVRLNLVLIWVPLIILCSAFFGYLFTARSMAIDATQEMYVVFDLYGVCVDANKKARQFFEKTCGTPRPPFGLLANLAGLSQNEEKLAGHVFEVASEKEPHYYQIESFTLSNSFSRQCGEGYIIFEVTEWMQQVNKLSTLATVDTLTGAYNRRYLDDYLAEILPRAAARQHPIAVLMLDIDHFKRINDTHGHAVGDEILRDLVGVCLENIRPDDVFFRYGGEEFVAVIENVDEATAQRMANRICAAVRDHAFETAVGQLHITVSIGGLSLVPTPEAKVLEEADRRLYAAKSFGRDRVVFGG